MILAFGLSGRVMEGIWVFTSSYVVAIFDTDSYFYQELSMFSLMEGI